MRLSRLVRALVVLGGLGLPSPATADLTVFGGATLTTPARPTLGVALGLTLRRVSLEAEYAHTQADPVRARPSRSTATLVLLLRTPRLARARAYGTVGGGLVRADGRGGPDVDPALALGGGITIDLVRTLQLRLDYRLLRASPGPEDVTHRISAGLTLPF